MNTNTSSSWRLQIKGLWVRVCRRFGDERGESPWIVIASALLLSIVGLAIAATTYSVVRTGQGILDSFGRSTQLNTVALAFQSNLNNLTDITVNDDQSLTVSDQPSKRTAYYSYPVSGAPAPSTCVTHSWQFVPAANGLLDLQHIVNVYSGDACTGTPTSTRTAVVTGFVPGTHFTFQNAAGRDLHYSRGQELGVTASANTRPAGLFDNEWKYPYPTIVNVQGAMQNLFNTTPVAFDAVTSLKQLRPGAEPWTPGVATAPTIMLSQVQGDLWQAAFSPTIPIPDNRAVLTWAQQNIVGTGTQQGAIGTFTASNILPGTITQGNRWQIQAAYRIALGGTTTTSATGTVDWVRPIDTPAAPTVALTGTQVTVTPSACPTGTSVAMQARYNINAGGWTAWFPGPTVGYTLREGDQVLVQATQTCTTIYTSSAPSLPASSVFTKPIVTQPIVGVTGSLSGGVGTATITVSGCPAFLQTQILGTASINGQPYAAGTAWMNVATSSATSVYASTVNEGALLQVGASGRCVSPYTVGPVTAAYDQGRYVRPITTAPWAIAGVDRNGGTLIAGRLAEGGCPAGTSYQWAYGTIVDGNWWGWSGFMSTTSNWIGTGTSIGYGQTFQAVVHDRCVTAYATGPNSADSYSRTGYRAYPAPGTPKITNANAVRSCDQRQLQIRVFFNGVSYASRYDGRAQAKNVNGVYTTWQEQDGFTSGSWLVVNAESSARLSLGSVLAQIRAYGVGGYSSWSASAGSSGTPGGCYN